VRLGRNRPLRFDARLFWIFQALFWIASTFSLKVMIATFLPVDQAGNIIYGRILTGVVMTTLLHFAYQSRWMHRAKKWVKWSSIFFLNIGFCFAGAAFWVEMIRRGATELPAESPFLSMALARFYSLSLWNIAYFGLSFILNYHTLKLESAEARLATRSSELQQLQSQLNPHFLFNTLALLQNRIGPASPGQEVIQMLSEHLRYSLAQSKPLEPLGRELDALESYLELQRARFADQLDCYIEASPAASRVLVPPMLVQPLLENAFKFGPRSSGMPLRVAVTASVRGGELVIDVTNSGSWVPPGGKDSTGTGLANLRRRLFLLLGESATLEVVKHPDTVVAELRLPVLLGAAGEVSNLS
jgi:sensor histidine kinase YesM